MRGLGWVVALAAGLAAPAWGQSGGTVSAAQPEALVSAMREAGFEAELKSEPGENPEIATELGGWSTTIYLYDCDDSYEKCQTLLLRTGFNRKEAMPLEMVNGIVSKQRYMAIYLDDEGDPWADWDIVTGDGIAKSVFFYALRKYGEQVDALSETVFEAERAADGE